MSADFPPRDLSWKHRVHCAHALMASSFTHGIGRLNGVEPRLAAALCNVLSRPGSLVRAVSSYLVGLSMGMTEEGARSLGCGIEYLHTASLIFDDFPAMDDAKLRRDAPCLHVSHGEAVATLAALALINRGYTLIWQTIHQAAPSRRAEAGNWVDSKLGVHGLLGGQAWDLHGWDDHQTAAEVSEIAARKTADLLRLTLVLPAIVGHGTRREIRLLDRLALLRGLAYQAADDVKDLYADEFCSGKTGGRDQELGRPNLVVAEGLTAATARCARLVSMGDRVQHALPGAAHRWNMLDLIRVPAPRQVMGSLERLPAVV
ncbi:polyprenyl synthetase family protein [Luteolibacter pohnpeiensis]|uniref:Polyprenyl synthetase family protein n=1 Tax=Luteolibacter pohnpeiensis TaxID=454153 RepID=A0A934VX00_9BACT|nr:polyprenyl synthetase family protein [Luteolibacter pohnpeiensis]MBK1883054.1 polyprenyl synthetase family protein [Luteolibacter pohnpeiensis]